MPGRKQTHSEEWWASAPPHAIRCEGHYKSGERCRREAILGGNVCKQHGGAAPQVRQMAAARIANHADAMAALLIEWANDPNVEVRDRAKIAQDLLDRADVAGTSKVLVGVGEIDPVERLFRDLLADPDILAPVSPTGGLGGPEIAALNRRADPQEADGEWDDVVDAEVVEDDHPHTVQVEESMSSRPPAHIAKALKELGL